MKKLLIIPLSFFIITIMTIIIRIITFANIDHIYDNLITKLPFKNSTIEKNNIKINKFPLPFIFIEEINANEITLKNITIKINILYFLLPIEQFTAINIKNVIVHTSDFNLLNHDKIVTTLIKQKPFNIKIIIKQLNILDTNNLSSIVHNLIINYNKKNISLSAIINHVWNIEALINKKKSNNTDYFSLQAEGAGYKLNLVKTYVKDKLVSGEVGITINNLYSNISDILPASFNRFFNNTITNYEKEETKISFNIVPKNEIMILDNINIISPSISGSGQITIANNLQSTSNINLHFSKINFSNQKNSNINDNNLKNNINLLKNITLDFDKYKINTYIQIDNITLNEGHSFSNIKLQSTINNNQLYLQEFTGLIDKQYPFYITGKTNQDNFQTIFQGSLVAQHSNLDYLAAILSQNKIQQQKNDIPYKISLNIKLTSIELSCNDIVVTTPNLEITGNINTKLIGSIHRTNANLYFSDVLINKNNTNLPGANQILYFIQNLFTNMNNENFSNKLSPIKAINSISNYNIYLKKITIEDKSYNNLNFYLTLLQNQIKLENLNIKYNNHDLNLNIHLQLDQQLQPNISALISTNYFDSTIFDMDYILNNSFLQKFSLDKVNFNIIFNASKIKHNNLLLTNVECKIKNDSSLKIQLDYLNANIFNGSLQLYGNIMLSPLTLQLSYILNSANLNQIINNFSGLLLSENLSNNYATISSSGIWTTHGTNINELFYNMYSESNAIIKNLEINNFSIDDFIKKISNYNYSIYSLNTDIKNALSKGTTNISQGQLSFNLTQGILSFPSISLNTNYTNSITTGYIDIYKFFIDLNSIFSFYLFQIDPDNPDKIINTMNSFTLNTSGDVFNPEKKVRINEIRQLLEKRSLQ